MHKGQKSSIKLNALSSSETFMECHSVNKQNILSILDATPKYNIMAF